MDFYLVVLCILVCYPPPIGSSVHYKAIHWSPRNPLFRFTPEQFQDGKAFVQKAVKQSSMVYFVCPNPTSEQGAEFDDAGNIKKMYENLWIVEEKSFMSCNIPKTSRNKLIFYCNNPPVLSFRLQVFQPHSAGPDALVFEPGNRYYFIATSDGSKSSLNNTLGGHCNDTKDGVSMRIEFYVCLGENDTACNQMIKNGDISTTSNPQPTSNIFATPQASVGWPKDFWEILAMVFGGSLGVAIIIIIILLCILCTLKSQRRELQSAEMQGLTAKANA